MSRKVEVASRLIGAIAAVVSAIAAFLALRSTQSPAPTSVTL